jgi:transcriptional regulator with XRE-family HTH domain
MKMRIGNRLMTAREERKLSQAEMAELLNVSSSTYSRLERNESAVDLEQIVGFSKTLQIPVQEFLPDTFSINSSSQQNQNSHIGLVIGNVTHYSNRDEIIKNLETKVEAKDQENQFLKEKISLLETSLTDLRNTVALLQKEK